MTQRERHQHDYREDDDRQERREDNMQRGRQQMMGDTGNRGQQGAYDQSGMNDYGRGQSSGQQMGRGNMADYDQGGMDRSWSQGRPQAGMSGGGNWGANYGQSGGGSWSQGGRGNMADYDQGGMGQNQEHWNQSGMQGQGSWNQGGVQGQGSMGQGQGSWSQGGMGQRGPHTGRGPKGYQRSDDRIREDVCEVLTQHGNIDASEIEIDVKNGEVTLRGTVDSRQTKRMAEDAIEHLSGVREINNQLRVSRGDQGGRSSQSDQSDQSSQGSQQRAVGGSGSSTTSG
jgi:osmotically-inducible protein OsmY